MLMAKGTTKNIKAFAKHVYKQTQNFKHSTILNHNVKYLKKEIETMLLARMPDKIAFYHILPIKNKKKFVIVFSILQLIQTVKKKMNAYQILLKMLVIMHFNNYFIQNNTTCEPV